MSKTYPIGLLYYLFITILFIPEKWPQTRWHRSVCLMMICLTMMVTNRRWHQSRLCQSECTVSHVWCVPTCAGVFFILLLIWHFTKFIGWNMYGTVACMDWSMRWNTGWVVVNNVLVCSDLFSEVRNADSDDTIVLYKHCHSMGSCDVSQIIIKAVIICQG
jgi:hypothetical protein